MAIKQADKSAPAAKDQSISHSGVSQDEWAVPGVTGKNDEQRRIPVAICDTLDILDSTVSLLSEQLDDLDAPSSQAVAERLVITVRKLQAAHHSTVGRATREREWPKESPHRTPTAWIRETQQESPGAAKALQADEEWLLHNPIFAQLFKEGRIPLTLISAARRHVTRRPWRQEAFHEVEGHFAEVAQRVDSQRFDRVLRTWGERVDDAALSDSMDVQDSFALQQSARRASLHQVGDMWELAATLPAIDGALLAGVLNQIMEEERRTTCTCRRASCVCPDDGRTVQQRRADALTALTSHAAHTQSVSSQSTDKPAGDESTINGPIHDQSSDSAVNLEPPVGNIDRTKVMLLIPFEQLLAPHSNQPEQWDFRGYVGHELDLKLRSMAAEWMVANGPGAGHLDRSTALAELCDTVIQRIITGPHSEPLDIGRKTRIIPPAIRSALIARDRGCVFDGCDIPAGWCHAHHIRHWAHGGSTDLNNLALLCDRHHAAVHNNQWDIGIDAHGMPRVRRTDE